MAKARRAADARWVHVGCACLGSAWRGEGHWLQCGWLVCWRIGLQLEDRGVAAAVDASEARDLVAAGGMASPCFPPSVVSCEGPCLRRATHSAIM